MPLTLTRRPRPGKVLHQIVIDEVREAYKTLASNMIKRLDGDVSEWDEKPEFKAKVGVGTKQWRIAVGWDTSTEIGKIYGWVNYGTGERGGGQAYEIYPVNAKALHFFNPRIPIKTQPMSYVGKSASTGRGGIIGALTTPATNQVELYRQHVHAPGIRPRNFIKAMTDEMKDRSRPGSFKSVTDAAMKRAARKIGKGAK